ncbi:hypothetical protein ANCCEY_11429 [Ancylostoma ceylanicum]|uniref:Reverse transcriptase domain-containing protein n=2 Tax=Ancylostoma ceylanicum TaxID=53326 RepID=A0A0D6LHV3_9BILA|nr:hypothetical protein ANCCEY_11429 [Ancylostoma ceylanicum]EYC06772.1 hypothetical protein Y032_0074g885 [Ancylostoma ceylanicum]
MASRFMGKSCIISGFADDIVLIAHDDNTAIYMLKRLNQARGIVGLCINRAKTKVTLINYTGEGILLETDKIDVVGNYMYLGQQVTYAIQPKKKFEEGDA